MYDIIVYCSIVYGTLVDYMTVRCSIL